MQTNETKTRSGTVAIVGRPNVGKSTLLNHILDTKLAIVSKRPQTTRNRILGVRTWGQDQLVLLDTPGIHRGRAQLNRYMVAQAMESLAGVDCVLLMTAVRPDMQQALERGEAVSLHQADTYVLDQVRRRLDAMDDPPTLLVVINKIDRLTDRRPLLPLIAAWTERGYQQIVPVSALRGEGVERLVQELRALLPEGEHHYAEDMFTDQAERFIVAELVREQVFQRCRQEVPYSTAVEIMRFKERPDRDDVMIEAVIHAERESQKAILVGKKGSMIKQIGMAAREEISRLLGTVVHLKLTVHVEPNWTGSRQGRKKLGYE